jgi:hypothetical protein
VFASDDADWVAGKDTPAPLVEGVVPPTPMVDAESNVPALVVIRIVTYNTILILPPIFQL